MSDESGHELSDKGLRDLPSARRSWLRSHRWRLVPLVVLTVLAAAAAVAGVLWRLWNP